MKVQSSTTTIIDETSDENIVKYLSEKIFLCKYDNTKNAKKYGILTAAFMEPNCMQTFNDIKNKLESMDKNDLRQIIARNIINRSPIFTGIIAI